MVGRKRLELLYLTVLASKTSVSANSTTCPFRFEKSKDKYYIPQSDFLAIYLPVTKLRFTQCGYKPILLAPSIEQRKKTRTAPR